MAKELLEFPIEEIKNVTRQALEVCNPNDCLIIKGSEDETK